MTVIVAWVWQGLAIACLTALMLRAAPRLNAATRHAIWWMALAAVLAIPVAHLAAHVAAEAASAPDLAGSASIVAGMLVLPTIPDWVTTCAITFWALTVAVGVLRVARGFRAVGRMKRASAPFDPAREARLPMWIAARDAGRRRTELRTSDGRAGACALGLGRPRIILVSRSFADGLGDVALDEIVVHEQAHLERRDDWLQLLQAIVGSLAGWHPAVRFITRQIDIDREAACDDRVVARTGAARRYAWSLAVAAADAAERDRPRLAPGATSSVSTLRRRVDRLLDTRRDRGARLARATSLTGVTALAIAVVVAPRVTPIVAFVSYGSYGEPADAPAPIKALAAAYIPLATAAATGGGVPAIAAPAPATGRHGPKARLQASASVEAQPTIRDASNPPPAAPLASRRLGGESTTLALQSAPPVSLMTDRTAWSSEDMTPWSAVAASATAVGMDATRTATSTASEAKDAGVSLGRFMTRAGRALANRF